MSDKIVDMGRAKAEDRTGIRDTINPVASWAHMGEVRAVAVVAVREDGSLYIKACAGASERDKHSLNFGIDQIKQALLGE